MFSPETENNQLIRIRRGTRTNKGHPLGIVVRGKHFIASDPFLELLQGCRASILVRLKDHTDLSGLCDPIDCGMVVLFVLCPLGHTLVAHLPDVLRFHVLVIACRWNAFRFHIAGLLPFVRLCSYEVLREFYDLLQVTFELGQLGVLRISQEGDFNLEKGVRGFFRVPDCFYEFLRRFFTML